MTKLLPLEEHLRHALEQHVSKRRLFYVAFSGGKDSTALLHATCVLRNKLAKGGGRTGGTDMQLHAWHINHCLMPQSQQWETHCRQECKALDVPLIVSSLNPDERGKESPEMFARRARYAIWQEQLPAKAVLLLAHHAEDQAETLLLQLMRGSPTGMPQLRYLDKPASSADLKDKQADTGCLLRPFLELPVEAIEEYLRVRSLKHITDPSNADERHERNYIRHKVMPVLKKKWNSASMNLAFAADMLAERRKITDTHYASLLQQHFEDVASSGKGKIRRGQPSPILSIRFLQGFALAERAEILLAWLRLCELSPPPGSLITELWKQAEAKPDATPLLEWKGGSIRRYDDNLYAMPPLPPVHSEQQDKVRLLAADQGNADTPGDCADAIPIIGKICLGEMHTMRVSGKGMRFPQSGEQMFAKYPAEAYGKNSPQVDRVRLAGRAGSRSLKKMLQEANIPPWLRPYLPMIYINDELAALANIGVLPKFVCEKGAGLEFVWQAPHYGLDAKNTGTGEHLGQRKR